MKNYELVSGVIILLLSILSFPLQWCRVFVNLGEDNQHVCTQHVGQPEDQDCWNIGRAFSDNGHAMFPYGYRRLSSTWLIILSFTEMHTFNFTGP